MFKIQMFLMFQIRSSDQHLKKVNAWSQIPKYVQRILKSHLKIWNKFNFMKEANLKELAVKIIAIVAQLVLASSPREFF